MFQAPYRAAVIGRTGKGDYGHSLDLSVVGNPKLNVVAVADEDEKGRAAAAKRLGIDKTYADYRVMLDETKPHFVVVAPRFIDNHKAMILDCVERGIHVFTEKPLVPDLVQADAIVSACERAHVKLAIAFQTRYGPTYEQVKKLITEGAIGEILELRGRGKEDHRGGGEDLMVLGPHLMDFFRGFLGDATWCFSRVTENGRPITRASAKEGPEGLGLIAGDRVDATYGFKNTAAVAHFATAKPTAGATKRFALHIYGSKGVIELPTGYITAAYLLDDPTWSGAAGKKWVPISSNGLGQPETVKDPGLNAANKRIVDDLIHAVETDTQPMINIYDARANLEMILACHASALAGKPVELPLMSRKHPLA